MWYSGDELTPVKCSEQRVAPRRSSVNTNESSSGSHMSKGFQIPSMARIQEGRASSVNEAREII